MFRNNQKHIQSHYLLDQPAYLLAFCSRETRWDNCSLMRSSFDDIKAVKHLFRDASSAAEPSSENSEAAASPTTERNSGTPFKQLQ